MEASSASLNLSETSLSRNKSNSISPSGSSSKWVEICVQLVFLVILMLVIIIGNVLVMVAYKVNHRLRTGTYTLLVSLAFCDFLVGVVSLPMWIKIISTGNWTISHLFETFYYALDYFTALSSSVHLTLICLERWLAISKPFFHQTLTNIQYYTAIAIVWLVCLSVSSLTFIPVIKKANKTYILVLVLTGFVFPMIIITLVNVYIFKVAKKLINEEPTGSAAGSRYERRKKVQKERRTAKTLVIITALFFLELLPSYTLAILGGFCLKACILKYLSWPEILRVMNIAKWMQYSNSGINPFIYAFRDAEMRRTFQRISSRAMFWRPFTAVTSFHTENNTATNVHQTTK